MRIVKTVINGAGEKEDVVLGKLSPRDLISMGRRRELSAAATDPLRKSTKKTPSSANTSTPAKSAPEASAAPESESDDQRLAREQSQPNLTPLQAAALPPEPKKEESRIKKLYNRVTGKKSKEEQEAEDEEEEEEEEDPTTPSDTPRLDRDTPTWTPTLLRAPLPGTVIDELRGKYSKFRTRHEPQFVKRMQQIDSAKQAHEKWVKSGAGLLDTPRKEAVLRAQAAKREARRRNGGLDDTVLEGIGKVMWQRGMRLTPRMEIEARKRGEKVQGRLSRGAVAAGEGVEAWRKELAEAEAR